MENAPLDVITEGEKAIQEGSKALTKFQEIVHDLFKGHFMRKQTDANFYKYEKQANFIRDNQDLNIMFKGDEIYMLGKPPEALAIRANERMLMEAIRQENNVEDVLDLTKNEFKSEENVSDEPVDEDWLCRFFGIAKDVNSYEMKFIWAKILAGEIKQPGSFSMRTLETLKNISQKEAETFQKILPFVIMASDDNMFVLPSKEWNEGNYSYSDVMLLDECGLISSTPFIHHRLDLENNETRMLFNKKKTLIIKSASEKEEKISIEIYTLTKTGTELYNILSFEPDDQYLENLAKYIFDKHKNKIEVYVYKTDWYNSEAVSYDDKTVFAEYK
ncbi:MAG: DUF2806 domain-containing protein [Oscillospiraceae bacterium]|nr:DUF2806 domain-containing protein [Oscillospiraceae bacterium]